MTDENLHVSLDNLAGFDLCVHRHVGPYAQKAAGFAQLLLRPSSDWRARG